MVLNVRRETDGAVWFEASRKWGVDRVVVYEGNNELVPLLPEEVPFRYDDIGEDLVFLWERNSGIALATSRSAAVCVTDEVRSPESRRALFGSGTGYCYGMITGKDIGVGAYPTVRELLDAGVDVRAPGHCFTQVGDELYHCVEGFDGLSLSQLPMDSVIGAGVALQGFTAGGVTNKAFEVHDLRQFERSCVVGASRVDLSVRPSVWDSLEGVEVATVNWLGSVPTEDGDHLSVALVIGNQGTLPGNVAVDVGPDVKSLYWVDSTQRLPVTRAVDVVQGKAVVQPAPGLIGCYVFCRTQQPMAQYQPVKYKAVLHDCEQGQLPCYAKLLMDRWAAYPKKVSWATLMRYVLVPDEDMMDFNVSSCGTGQWHVGPQLGMSALSVVTALRCAQAQGRDSCKVGSILVKLTDMVGAVGRMTEALKESLNSLRNVNLEELDDLGGRLSGMPISMMSSADKEQARVLQAVGDNVISLVLSERVLDGGGTAQEYQELRSRTSSNAFLTEKFVASEYLSSFQVTGAHVPAKTGGAAVESMVGTVYRAAGVDAVRELMVVLAIQ